MLSWLVKRAGVPEVSVEALCRELDSGAKLVLLDVRQPMETRGARLPGAVRIPLSSLRDRMGELDRERDIVVYCHSGARSAMACSMLQRAGFARVRNLSGGIMAWQRHRR